MSLRCGFLFYRYTQRSHYIIMCTMQKIVALSLCFVCLTLCCLAQSVENSATKEYVPPTPTAAALGKYVDMPVSLYSGVPEISIPIYEIKTKSLTLPIALSYHAGGFRVEEEASWVGLGWSLQAGGAITSSIRHLQDNGGFRDSFFNSYQGEMLGDDPYGYNSLSRLAEGTVDGSPDIYTYNFNGKGGKFIWIGNKPIMLPLQPLDIQPLNLTNITRGWTVRDEQGNQYIFKEEEQAKTRSKSSASLATTSWFLSSIITPTQDTVSFEYKDTEFFQNVSLSESKVYSQSIGGYMSLDTQHSEAFVTTMYGKTLSRITFPGGQVEFISSANRLDIRSGNPYAPPLRLDVVKVLDSNGRVVKKMSFKYDYFRSSPGTTEPAGMRLKLLSLTQAQDPNLTQEEDFVGPSHTFAYETGYELPSKLSKARDHWGYYNGKDQNNSLVPELVQNSIVSCGNDYSSFTLGAQRDPDEKNTLAGLLTKITYPTKGYTKFTYGANKYGFVGNTVVSDVRRVTTGASSDVVSGHTAYPGISPDKPEGFSEVIEVKKAACMKLEVNIQLPAMWDDRHQKAVVELYQYGGEGGLQLLSTTAALVGTLMERFTQSGTYYYDLSPGQYYIKATGSIPGSMASVLYSCTTDYKEVTDQVKLAGGARIEKIVQHDGFGPDFVKTYNYDWQGDNLKSSGVLVASPQYLGESYAFTSSGTGYCSYNSTVKTVVSSQSTNILGLGSHIGYREVTVRSGPDGSHGKSVSRFTSAYDFPSWQGGGESDMEWQRGLLLSKKDFHADGTLVARLENDYATLPDAYKEYYGLRVSLLGEHPCAQDTYGDYANAYPKYFKQSPSIMVSEWRYVSKSRQVLYHQGDSVQTQTEYFYHNPAHLQLTKTKTITSDGKVLVNSTSFPEDFADVTGFLAELKAAHILAPVEQVTYQEDAESENAKVVAGTLTTYKPGGKGLPDALWTLETGAPIAAPSFKFANKSAGGLPHSGANEIMVKDSRYRLHTSFASYDRKGNPSMVTPTAAVPVSYIWSYENVNPIAQITNATYAEVEAALGGTAVVESLSSSLTLSTSQLDQLNGLRDQLPHAMVTIYTYDPLVGISTITDPNGRTSYYEYDKLGRLSKVLDKDKNIIKTFEYNYSVD